MVGEEKKKFKESGVPGQDPADIAHIGPGAYQARGDWTSSEVSAWRMVERPLERHSLASAPDLLLQHSVDDVLSFDKLLDGVIKRIKILLRISGVLRFQIAFQVQKRIGF